MDKDKKLFRVWFNGNQKILEAKSVSEILMYLLNSNFVEDIYKIEQIEDENYI